MALVLYPAKGCVYTPGGASVGKGFYALKPALTGSREAPILLDGIDLTDSDIVQPVATLDEKLIVFVMGRDFGNVAISGMALLGKADQNGQSFQKVVSYFEAHRVSSGASPITVSLPGKASAKVLLTSITVARPDPQFHVQYFMLRGIVVSPVKA